MSHDIYKAYKDEYSRALRVHVFLVGFGRIEAANPSPSDLPHLTGWLAGAASRSSVQRANVTNDKPAPEVKHGH